MLASQGAGPQHVEAIRILVLLLACAVVIWWRTAIIIMAIAAIALIGLGAIALIQSAHGVHSLTG
jgi:hypothetical protein